MKTAHVYVFDTLSDWEIAYAVVGINNPAFQKSPGEFCVKTVGLEKTPVVTMGGITILPDMKLDEMHSSQSAMLILPGGINWEEGKNTETVEIARSFLNTGIPVAAICGATLSLAQAGILDDKRHTSNSLDYLKSTHYHGELFYENQPAVTDNNLITAAGIAPLEFAYHIFKKLDLYSPEKLDAWYALFKTGNPSHYADLIR
jgi:putative intracellular protease/amidase